MTICLTIIAKNERENIASCILSAYAAGVTHVAILDTGSTDDTQEFADDLCTKMNIPHKIVSKVYPQPFRFDDARNESFDLARSIGTDYLFYIDADDRLTGNLQQELSEPIYKIKVQHGHTHHYRPHLIRSDVKCRWRHPRHEWIELGGAYNQVILDGISVVVNSVSSTRTGNMRYLEDAQMLMEEFYATGCDQRLAYYIAQSYKDAGNNVEAIRWYKKRVALGGWDQEVSYSWIQLGFLSNFPDVKINCFRLAIKACPYRIDAHWELIRVLTSLGLSTQDAVKDAKQQLLSPWLRDCLFLDARAIDAIASY